MRIKEVHEEELRKFVESSYNIKIKKIKYFPLGEDGASYIIWTDKNNIRKFVKVYNKGEVAYKSIQEVKVILEFLYKAREKYGLEHFPFPIRNRNRNIISKFNGFPVVMYDYISGGNIKQFTKNGYMQLGEIIAKLHSLNKKNFNGIKKEQLDLRWESKILTIISQLKKTNKYGELSKEILAKEELLRRGIVFLKKEVVKIHKMKKNEVIVHADLHKGNLMREKEFIYVIDWDGLELALPEKDLMWFSEGINLNFDFKDSYRNNLNKKFVLDKDILRFYIVKRIFSEIVFFSRVIMFRKLSLKEKKERLNIIKGGINRLERVLK